MNRNNEKRGRKSDFNTSSKDNSSSNASLLPSSSQSLRQASLSPPDNNKLENVLILQGGGSLGALSLNNSASGLGPKNILAYFSK